MTFFFSYIKVFASPWAESRDLEQRHAKLTKEMSSWPINPKDPARHVDKVQVKRPLYRLLFKWLHFKYIWKSKLNKNAS